MTVVCKVKDRIVDLETWVNNAEFDDKVNRVARFVGLENLTKYVI